MCGKFGGKFKKSKYVTIFYLKINSECGGEALLHIYDVYNGWSKAYHSSEFLIVKKCEFLGINGIFLCYFTFCGTP